MHAGFAKETSLLKEHADDEEVGEEDDRSKFLNTRDRIADRGFVLIWR